MRGPIDPRIKAIRDEAAAKVREYHATQASAKILANITGKLLPKLTDADCESLATALAPRIDTQRLEVKK